MKKSKKGLKKGLVLATAVVMGLSLFGCGSKEEPSTAATTRSEEHTSELQSRE